MLTLNLVIILCYFSVAWAISAVLRRADIIDVFWGPGFAVAGIAGVRVYDGEVNNCQLILLAAVVIWAARLGLHLLVRWWGEEHEDRRYAALRAAGTRLWWLRSLVTVFCFQGTILWLVALPLQYALAAPTIIQPAVFALGLALWTVGFVFETIGDWQLTRFRSRADSRDKVLNTGLWRYTRHPNYFGDFLVWWGFFVMAVSIGAPFWTVISPIVMSAFLMKFSGVGILEKDIASRRPGYAEYVESTSTFFPAPPKLLENATLAER